jgi:putative FmdB family regulatory protein
MPIYTYECAECGVHFDARQKFTDDPLDECPECGGQLHRVPQAVGIVFKGSGWYVKDSRGRNNLAVPPKKDGETSSGDTTATGKDDSASASESKSDVSTDKD